jgi:hypothetical protein
MEQASPNQDRGERDGDLRLARLHLRGGTYALARAELEALAGADRLDRDAVLDLAEVRWRTGDLAGAAAAADAWLDEGEAPGAPLVLAHVICAEAAADRGRAEEAAAHVEAAAVGLGDAATLDAILAGIVARAAWPWEAPKDAAPSAASAAMSARPAAAPAGGVPGLAGGVPVAPAAAELVRAGTALLADAPGRAAVLLALAVRADRAAAVAFVRAEALRAAGHHEEARIAYASAEHLALAPAEAGPQGSSQ